MHRPSTEQAGTRKRYSQNKTTDDEEKLNPEARIGNHAHDHVLRGRDSGVTDFGELLLQMLQKDRENGQRPKAVEFRNEPTGRCDACQQRAPTLCCSDNLFGLEPHPRNPTEAILPAPSLSTTSVPSIPDTGRPRPSELRCRTSRTRARTQWPTPVTPLQ